MGEECVRDELRTLFLFEKLTDEQLDDALRGWPHRDFSERAPCARRVTLRPAST